MSSPGSSIVLTRNAVEAARALIAQGIVRTPVTPLWNDDSEVDLAGAVAGVLEPFLAADVDVLGELAATRTGRQSWVSLEADRAAAVLSVTLRRVEPGDLEYAYLPPAYAALGMAGALADRRSDLPALRALFRRASALIREAGIDQVTVQIRAGDWLSGSLWRELGFRPDSVLAARTSTTPLASSSDVVVRPALAEDIDALVEMSRQEQDFHALHTRTGSVQGQPVDTTRDTVLSWLAPEATAPTLVAEDPVTGAVVGCSVLMILTAPPGTARASYLPATHGYLALVNVDETCRGRGVGRALTAAALHWFSQHDVEAVMLHYIDDNPLSRPFWSRMGFAPVAETLRGSPLPADPADGNQLDASNRS